MIRKLLLPALLVATVASGVSAQTEQRWLHIRVDGSDPEGETVRVNLPFELVKEMLPMIEVGKQQGSVHVDMEELHGVDLPALVRALRKSQDGEYVTVEGHEETVRISKEGDHLFIRVDEEDEHVDIRLRLAVVDALLSGENGELNLVAAAKALEEEGDCEIVRVDSDDEKVRIWIDRQDSTD